MLVVDWGIVVVADAVLVAVDVAVTFEVKEIGSRRQPHKNPAIKAVNFITRFIVHHIQVHLTI